MAQRFVTLAFLSFAFFSVEGVLSTPDVDGNGAIRSLQEATLKSSQTTDSSNTTYSKTATTTSNGGLSAHKQLYPVKWAAPRHYQFVPLSERDLQEALHDIGGEAKGEMTSLVSVSVSTDQTVIWVDHWEDGFESRVKRAVMNTTEVWGDGDASNGCRPDVKLCQDADDYLFAGDSFLIESRLPYNRTADNWLEKGGIKYDSGDMIASSYPITLTRSAFSEVPGTDLAGAVEVMSTKMWGKSFVAPVGEDFETETNAFAVTRVFLMSGTDSNTVTLPDGNTTTLNKGQSMSFAVKQGDTITSTKNLQAHLVTGDRGSFEMRWFSLAAINRAGHGYQAAVGDDAARTKLLLYNHNEFDISVVFTVLNELGEKVKTSIAVGSKKGVFSPVIPTGSGAHLYGVNNKKFQALSVTDSEVHTLDKSGNLVKHDGQQYDWGYPLVSTSLLTSQVLVGWGYGCNEKSCGEKPTSSAVFVSPSADADIWIDYDNRGIVETFGKVEANELESVMIRGETDTDLSAARIFATKRGSGSTGPGVKFMAAWGQDPTVGQQDQLSSMDLGTAIIPFPVGAGRKGASGKVEPGAKLTFYITIENDGPNTYPAGGFSFFDELPSGVTYIDGSAKYSDDAGQTWFALDNDVTGKTIFMLDEEGGLASPRELSARGGVHRINYDVLVDSPLYEVEIRNDVLFDFPDDPDITSSVVRRLSFNEDISLENTVYVGDEGEAGCKTAKTGVEDFIGTPVTWCLQVTNSGKTYLDNIRLSDYSTGKAYDFTIPTLAPGESKLVTYATKISGNYKNVIQVEGNPIWDNLQDIPTLKNVRSLSTAVATERITKSPTTSPTNTPTTSPTNTPTTSPTNTPTTSPTKSPTIPVQVDIKSGNKGGGGGDPHFKTWTGHKFDYHGECDLVLIDNPSFANGLGLRVHIRTTRDKFFSYIERAAVQIGSDVLEFANDIDNWTVNGEKTQGKAKLAKFEVRKFGRRAVSVRLDEKAKAKIDLKFRSNGMPYVVVDGGDTTLFEGSLGLLGEWQTGRMIGRDGVTQIDSGDTFGLEWQVRDTEPMLFKEARSPQFPTVCTPPEFTLGSRLGDSHMKKAAEKLCAAWKEDKDECIFDVMATRNIHVADDPIRDDDTEDRISDAVAIN